MSYNCVLQSFWQNDTIINITSLPVLIIINVLKMCTTKFLKKWHDYKYYLAIGSAYCKWPKIVYTKISDKMK